MSGLLTKNVCKIDAASFKMIKIFDPAIWSSTFLSLTKAKWQSCQVESNLFQIYYIILFFKLILSIIYFNYEIFQLSKLIISKLIAKKF